MNTSSYLVVKIAVDKPELQEILIAELGELEYDSFQEHEAHLEAYVPTNAFNQSLLDGLLEQYKAFSKLIEVSPLPNQNWNELWESNFPPVMVDNDILIRAPFHKIEQEYPLTIHLQPKMAFGTGHHETTWLMLSEMRGLDFKGKKVFDYGCGTSILAIAAEKMGASEVLAVDIEEWAHRNSIENCEANNCEVITVKQGTIDVADGMLFDVILANINRNTILQSLSTLDVLLKPNGIILFSGLLWQDKAVIEDALSKFPWKIHAIEQKGNWMMIKIIRSER